MPSVLMVSTPVRGHVTPLLSVASSLVDAGDRVRFLTGSRYREEVLSTGAEFLPLPAEADYDDRDMDAAFPGRRGLSGPAGIRFDLTEIFLRPVHAQLRAIREALAEEPVDALLAESMFAGAAVLSGLPRNERPLIVNLGIVPLSLKHPDVAPFGLGIPPRPGILGRIRNALLTTVAEKIIFAPVQRYADEITRGETGHGLDRFFLDWPSAADRLIQFTVPEFEYPRPGVTDRPASVSFVGPVSRTRASTVAAPEWWGDLDTGRPVIHVTQGTVANSSWSLVEATVRGLADEDVLVVVSTGGRPVAEVKRTLAASGDLPHNMRLSGYLPYDRLLPRTDVMVTNGGYGGVHYALEHGVPIVVAGRTEDKVEVSARVAWSGAGIDLRTDTPTPEQVRDAVRTVLAIDRYRSRAGEIGLAIRRSPGPGAVHDVIVEAVGESRLVTTGSTGSTGSADTGEPQAAPTLDGLAAALGGQLLRPGDDGWDGARAAWQLLVDQRPAAVVVAADEKDVATTVRHAAALGLRVACQATGHNAGPLGDLSRTILLRTEVLRSVTVDRRGATDLATATVDCGTRWGDLGAAAQEAGLTPVGGFSADVGVVGSVLGGGYGWFARSHGPGSASVLALRVVTSDGVTRDLSRADDLFRDVMAGADVAVVVSATLRLYRVGEVVAGAMFWPVESAGEVFRTWADWRADLPATVTSVVRVLRFPDVPEVPPQFAGGAFAVVEVVSQESLAATDSLIAGLRSLGPVADTVAPTDPASLAELHMDPPVPLPAVSSSALVTALPEEMLDDLVGAVVAGPGKALTSVEIRDLDGVVGDAAALVFAVGVMPPPDVVPPADALTALGEGLHAVEAACHPVQAARDVRTFTEAPGSSDRLFGEMLPALRTAKLRWDPTDLIHAAHPVLRT